MGSTTEVLLSMSENFLLFIFSCLNAGSLTHQHHQLWYDLSLMQLQIQCMSLKKTSSVSLYIKFILHHTVICSGVCLRVCLWGIFKFTKVLLVQDFGVK